MGMTTVCMMAGEFQLYSRLVGQAETRLRRGSGCGNCSSALRGRGPWAAVAVPLGAPTEHVAHRRWASVCLLALRRRGEPPELMPTACWKKIWIVDLGLVAQLCRIWTWFFLRNMASYPS